MDKPLSKHFEVTRNSLIKKAEAVQGEVADLQPKGFNNTIHWHIGHVLTVTEQFLFGYPKNSTNLSENYAGLFGNGTKPSDWEGEVPEIKVLISQLKDQLERILQIPSEKLNEPLAKPIMSCDTLGELAGVSLMHEANHTGQIHVMNRMLEQN